MSSSSTMWEPAGRTLRRTYANVQGYGQGGRVRDAALRRSERCKERLNPALALAELHVFELDHVARQLIKAGAYETFFSAPLTTEHLFRNIYFTVDPRDREDAKAAWEAHCETGFPYRPEYRIVGGTGEEVWVQPPS